MSKIEYKKLYEIVQTVNAPVKLKTEEYQLTGNYPIIDQGKEFQAGFTDDENALLPLGEYILYGDHTLSVKYYNGRFAQGADGLKILKCKEGIEKFIYYALCTFNLHSNEYKRHWTQAKQISIPLPPLAIQQEIVSVLDSFTTLIDKMKKEVEMRKKQMEVYREKLLSFKDGDCEWKIIGSCINHLRTGLNPRVHFKLNTPDADGYYITVRELKGFKFEPDEKTDRINHEAVLRINERSNLQIGDVLFSGTGTIGRTAYVDKEPTNWNIKEGVYAITPNKDIIDSIYLIHCLLSQKFMEEVEQKAGGSTVRSISMMDFKNIKIPVPPLSVQQEIVRTLDAFETYISKLEKLITLRQKQYEYYREKLLTFE